ncbi:MAG: acyl-CoA carboxylase subunit epsilon [Pseudonocardiales bacterium]|nr:acyl-CoA carboxylase subunit epsilon [Pseudonocardiales bacterium]
MSSADTPDAEDQTPDQRRTLFRLVRGEPDDAEVAALTAVLATAASASAAVATVADEGGRSVWVDRAAMMRPPMHPGPGAWRDSTWPG